jgi:hypothetical protein
MFMTQTLQLSRPGFARFSLALAPALVSLLACTSGSDGEGSEKTPSKTVPPEDTREWVRVIEGDWELEAGGEIPQQCVQQVLDEDVYVSAIRPVHPEGTHHTLVTLGDGSVSCTSSLVSNGIIYAAGVGSAGLDLPPGVALKFPKGSALSMGLHLYNPTDGVLRGTSAMEIVRLAPEDVKYEAEALLAGPFQLSEDVWMKGMLGLDVGLPPLPARENRASFLEHYADASARRLERLGAAPADWFAGATRFFDVTRSRAWVLTRRIAHSAHHRGQLTAYLRMLGRALYSTYGPTADTGGLFQQGAPVIYRYQSVEDVLAAARDGGGELPPLPGPGASPPTERPGRG